MGEKFKKFVEEGTDCHYVPLGAHCNLCGKRLGFFTTGFWSINTQHLSDGALCTKCVDKIRKLTNEMEEWMPPELLTAAKWRRCRGNHWQRMSIAQARELMALKEQADADCLRSYGNHAQALFRVQQVIQIEPDILSVGVARAKKLKNKLVLFGTVDQGIFQKGDAVRIDHAGVAIDASILEAYVFDPDVPENTLEVELCAHMGKQRLMEDQLGWLVLDIEEGVSEGDRVVK